jgi:hypothetical protein
MAITTSAPSSNLFVEYLDGQWNSKNSASVRPEVRAELHQKYGEGVGARDIIFASGNVIDVPNQTITIGLAESPIPELVVGTAVATTAAGANALLYLDASCFDANGNGPLRVGDEVLIPKAYLLSTITTDRVYRVFSISTDATTSKLYTLQPYANAGTTYTIPSQITTAIPSGTRLSLVANSFAPGTDQPAGMAESFETRTFSNKILKESLDFEGGQIAKNYYEFTGYEGNMALFKQNLVKAEFRLDVKEARAFFYSEWAENASMVQTTKAGVSAAVPSFGGMWPHADVYAQKLSYSGDFTIDNLYDAGILQQSRGVVPGSTNLFLVGPELGRDVEKAALDYIKTNSGGTDLLDKVKKEIGIDVTSFKVDGRTYVLWQPRELADPTGVGALDSAGDGVYSIATAGLIVPHTNVTVGEFNGQKNVTIPGVQLGYVNKNGENRRRKIGRLNGMNQMFGQDVTTGYDASSLYMLVHMTGIFAIPDQWVQVTKA